MFNFFSRKKDKNPQVLININTHNISSVVYEKKSQDNLSGKIIAASEEKIKKSQNKDLNITWKKILTGLEKVTKNYYKFNPQRIDCFLPNSLTITQTYSQKKEYLKETLINWQEVKSINKATIQTILENERLIFPDIIGDRNIIIENKITELKLNGYTTNLKKKRKAKKLELSQYISISSENLINQIKTVMRTINPRANLFLHTLPITGASIIPTLIPSFDHGFLFVNVSEDYTNISLIKGDNILSSLSISIGKNKLLKKLSYNDLTLEASSRLQMFKEGKLNLREAKRLKKKYLIEGESWINAINSIFKTMATYLILPTKVILIGDDLTSKIFIELLERSKLKEYILNQKDPEIIFFHNETLDDLLEIDTYNRIKVNDPLIPLEIFYINKLKNNLLYN